jgi:hypothetical protein
MRQQQKQTLSLVLLGLGLALMLWGHQMHALPVFSEDNDKGLATAESALIKEVSIGGLRREADGRLVKTYTGKAPQACPT